MNLQNARHYLMVGLRGMAMGAADVIPGVSGGTIAFITGIYEELVQSIKSVNGVFFKTLFREGIPAAWKHINGNFLVSVVGGIGISILSLARLMSWLLSDYPMLVWAFFFGLIVGSAVFIGRKIERLTWPVILLLLAGTLLAFYITIATPASTPEQLWFIFLSGSIAFCALILPGISGAFILVLLSKYEFMLNAVRDLQTTILLVFAAGGIAGVIGFSNIISWLFKKHPNATLALLSGFMIGSLNKLWPWKKVLEWRINSQGEAVPFLEQSIAPWKYADLFATQPAYQDVYGAQPPVFVLVCCALAGMGVIFVFMFLSRKKGEERI